MAVEIDQDIDAVGGDAPGRLFVIHARQIGKLVTGLFDGAAVAGAVIGAMGIGGDAHPGAVMEGKKSLHQMAQGVIPEIA